MHRSGESGVLAMADSFDATRRWPTLCGRPICWSLVATTTLPDYNSSVKSPSMSRSTMRYVILRLAVFYAVVGPGIAFADLITLSPTADATITGDVPFAVFDQWSSRSDSFSDQRLSVELSADASVHHDGLIEFDRISVPSNAQIQTATLRLKIDESSASEVFVIINAFAGIGLDSFPPDYYFQNANPNVLNPPSNMPVPPQGARHDFDVTSLVSDLIAADASLLTFQLSASAGETYTVVGQRLGGTWGPESFPELEIEFSSVPEPSSFLLFSLAASVFAFRQRRSEIAA